jgi:hypothetical protein
VNPEVNLTETGEKGIEKPHSLLKEPEVPLTDPVGQCFSTGVPRRTSVPSNLSSCAAES